MAPVWRWTGRRSRHSGCATWPAQRDQLHGDPGRPGGAAVQDQRQQRGAGEAAGIEGTVEFRTDVFDAASIAALVERLRGVLVAMTADSGNRS